ncbi:phosphate ABC transporter substrate-binding protein [Cupriavidus basilensis OR16]|uniref:Phosphate-binding protein PstS n=1 Tax=Cupriavidus basilensis OR16 TaxID=1127483 RepID=H1S748_9BURK|nr:phosphate ABC transporter substrate-binding protein PstS [Cupriavidus basilensis]EHP41655.1 phosphate ABC transporter substrate-binding protein [Cupriavidus basilensis OR16]
MAPILFWQNVKRHATLACLLAGCALSAHAGDITGAGSTFVYPLLVKWAATYYTKTGLEVNYQPTGSGNGIRQIKAANVTFGASDMPLKPDELRAAGLVQFPLVVGGVVPIVNLDGVAAGQVRFTGKVLADIYLGKIANWDDPAISGINPGIQFPNQKILVVHRSDSSGTTFNWADYLSKVSDEWKGSVGAGTTVKWPAGVGANGNEGVATYIKNVKGAIGYVELTYALQRKLPYTSVRNREGAFVEPARESFSAAVASADWSQHSDFYQVITDAPGARAWPITGAVFVIMPKDPKNAANSKAALAFFRWALNDGQADAAAEHYVALPPGLVKQIEAYWGENLK